MKTTRYCSRWNRLSSTLCIAVMASAGLLKAELSEPDNMIYGTIMIGTHAVTAADTDVVVEAQRTVGGEVISSYRMGDDAGLGNFYSLNLKVESLGSLSDTNASMAGEQVDIVLRDNNGVIGQTSYTFPERGHVERVDFGAPLDDADGNGLPDLWELAWLGAAGQDPNAIGQNGLSLMDNYVAGTDPANADDLFRVEITETNGPVEVAFVARRAEGPGYSGTTRYYTLESQSLSGAGGWLEVAGVADVAGNNQTVVHNTGSAGPTLVYRARVSLAAVQIPGGPVLSIAALGGGQVQLSWPVDASGFVLQESSTLDSSGWSDVAGTPSNDGTSWSLQVPAPTGARFWRLRD